MLLGPDLVRLSCCDIRDEFQVCSIGMALSHIGSRRSLGLVCVATTLILLFLLNSYFSQQYPLLVALRLKPKPDKDHPVTLLVGEADRQFDSLRRDEAHSLDAAAHNYRSRRGRHPPPGFDMWWQLAKEKDAVVIESFFDQIYTDLEPFWGKAPSDIRSFAKQWPHVISVRQNMTEPQIRSYPHLWMVWWFQMLQEIPRLPDVDLAFGVDDEPFSVLPFDLVSSYMEKAEQSRHQHNRVPLSQIRSDFANLAVLPESWPDTISDTSRVPVAPHEYWDFVAKACKPTDPVFTEAQNLPASWFPPHFSTEYTAGSRGGYVSNLTTAKNVCHNPNLRSLHGNLILPARQHLFTDLRPIFVVAKLAGIGNDILAPIPSNWVESEAGVGNYGGIGSTFPWEKKKNIAIWRGAATGGEHREGNWYGFQRHRLVAMMNKTIIAHVEEEMSSLRTSETGSADDVSYERLRSIKPDTFDWGLHNIVFPNQRLFNISALAYGKLASWVAKITDGAFTHFHCFPLGYAMPPGECSYLEDYYRVVPPLQPSEILHHKYVPDVDGQSSSGRFRGYLQSLSTPIKASVFAEWHDSRLVPWRHFVPMSNEFQEWWGLMQYFLGYKKENRNEQTSYANDDIGQKIGRQGHEWAYRVLRKEDMVLYLYRLVLEYARICDDDRVHLGYVDDLLDLPGHDD